MRTSSFILCIILLLIALAHADPTNVVITKNGTVLVNGKEFFVKGVGYSPVPPGDDLALPPTGDYFQSGFNGLWERDFPLITNLGANLIRVWSWDFIADHTSFLDQVDKSGLKILVPFMMSLEIYPNLVYPENRNQALTDFAAFLGRYHNHPAIFGYLIGNELNSIYGEDLPYVFSLVRDMINIRNFLNISLPITMPLAADSSLENILDTYYGTVDLDFWSIQVYSPEVMNKSISQFRDLREQTGLNKPVLISEFGVDAFGSIINANYTPTENQTLQAEKLTELYFIAANNSDIVMGAMVMEYNDEWWKGDYPDSYVVGESCPNLRFDVQNYCGNQLDNSTFIHEEFLGIMQQLPRESILGGYTYCVKPRRVFGTIMGWWRTDSYTIPADFYDTPVCGTVALEGAMYYLALPAVFIIILAAVVEVLRCRRIRRKNTEIKEAKEGAERDGGLAAAEILAAKENAVLPDPIDLKKLKHFLDGQITKAFYSFTTDLNEFEVARMRVSALVWNKVQSSSAVMLWTEREHEKSLIDLNEGDQPEEDGKPAKEKTVEWDSLNDSEKQLFSRMVAEVYYRYMEGYLLWREKVLGKFIKLHLAVQETQQNCIDWMNCLVLWNIVSQCSGTIAHSPEKVCQVFHFTKKYLQATSPNSASEMGSSRDPGKMSPVFARKKSRGNIYIDISPRPDRRSPGDDSGSNGSIVGTPSFRGNPNSPSSPSSIVASLHTIFESYYSDAKTHKINFDDLNQSGFASTIKDMEIDPTKTLHEQFFTVVNPELPVKVRKEPDESKKDKKGKKAAKDGEEGVVEGKGGVFKDEGDVTMDELPKPVISSGTEGTPKGEINLKSSLKGSGGILKGSGGILKGSGGIEGAGLREGGLKSSMRAPKADGTTPSSAKPKLNQSVSFNPATTEPTSSATTLSAVGRQGSLYPTFKIIHTANSIRVITMQQQGSSRFEESMRHIDTSFITKPVEPEPKYIKKYFPNRGGILGCIVCFGWLVRLDCWLLLFAKALHESTFEGSNRELSLGQLAFVDAIIALLVCVFRFPVAGVGSYTILDYVKLVWSVALFGVVLIATPLPIPGFPMLNMEIMGFSIPEVYLAASFLAAGVSEVRLNFIDAPFNISGRKDTCNLRAWVQGTAMFVMMVVGVAGIAVQMMMSDILGVLNSSVFFLSIALGFKFTLFLVVILILTPLLGYYAGIGMGRLVAKTKKLKYKDLEIIEHCRAYLTSLAFWFSVFLIDWVLLYQILMPAVDKVSFGMCDCVNPMLETSPSLQRTCEARNIIMCKVAVALMWSTTILVSFVFINACFNVVLIFAGFLIAVHDRVGNVKTWREVKLYFFTIQTKCMRAISTVFDEDQFYQQQLWNHFIDSLYEEHLLSETEKVRLTFNKNKKKKPVFNPAPVNKEACRRIIKFCWSLEAMLKMSAQLPEFRARHQVRSMPSWTVIVPCYTETSMYMQRDLLRPKNGSRISVIEYLQSIYPDEWVNLSKQLRDGKAGPMPQDLMEDFLATPIFSGNPEENMNLYRKGICDPSEVEAICFWASFRGQTLVRTLKGLCNYRKGLEQLAMMEEGVYGMSADTKKQKQRIKDIQKLVRSKFQIIIANQVFNKKTDRVWTKERQEAWNMMLTQFHDFDMVYNHHENRISCMTRYTKEGEIEFAITRPGELVIGEPKAENQAHALPFALNEIIQVNDMNMYNSVENAYKTPFMLNTNFNPPEDWVDASDLVPRYRIVGFPEHTYTRPLSMVGDLMGSAEFCFVTITQRVLAALRVRAHYGHPDFLDGYWVRTRGGVSKASHILNTNEDIFSGYELFGRGEHVRYVEYLEQEKGRESSFAEAFTFEAKLAKGAAQQIKSPHVYLLNERLPLLRRLSLFYGSLGFYLSTWFMSVTIDFYVFTILLFVGSGVTYHVLGLLNAVIAVPWIIQVGYVLALPLLLELTIERGFWDGFVTFIRRLLMGMIFFVFHVKTKSYFFAQGLLSGKGGYMGTGRGFGLDRRNMVEIYKLYFDSHFNNALTLLAACILFAIISGDSASALLLRLMSVLLVIGSWLIAPILFNPYPTRETQSEDVNQIVEWINATDLSISAKNTAIKGNRDAKTEAERKKSLGDWWGPKEASSWQAWFLKGVIDEWEAEDKLFRGFIDRITLYIQKFVFLFWRFSPWLFLALPSWSFESLYYFGYVVLTFLFFALIDKRHSENHENSTAFKISTILIIPSLLTVFVYGTITFKTLIICMFLYAVICYMLWTEMIPGLINIVKIKKFRNVHPVSVFPKRMNISNGFFVVQRLWPFAATLVMSFVNFLTVIFCSSLTSLIYNGKVADKWKRAHLHMKQQNMFVDPEILSSLRSRASSSGSGDDDSHGRPRSSSDGSSSSSGDGPSSDEFQREIEDVREEMADQVNFLQDKIEELMFKMGAMKSHMARMGTGGGGGGGGAGNSLMLSAAELRAQIEEKTKLLLDPSTPESELANINIELERLYSALESTEEYQAEVAMQKEERRLKNEPLNKAALAEQRAKYSEDSINNNKVFKERLETIPALRLILADPSDIVKKHQNDWKLLTTNLLTLEEMRAIAGNLPKFGRNQLRQLAWVDALENRIEKMANGELVPQDKPIKGVAKTIKRVRNDNGKTGQSLFAAIKARGETPAAEGDSSEPPSEAASASSSSSAPTRFQRPRRAAGKKPETAEETEATTHE